MLTNLTKGMCGGCGNETWTIYQNKEQQDKLICECTKCKSTTVIEPSKPKLEIEFGDDSEGRLAF